MDSTRCVLATVLYLVLYSVEHNSPEKFSVSILTLTEILAYCS